MSSFTPQSWYDFAQVTPLDPRTLIQTISLEDQANVTQPGVFLRSPTWLQNVAWVAPPMAVTPFAIANSHLFVPNVTDFASQAIAAAWNSARAMTSINANLPLCVENIMFLKAGGAFVNYIYLDWTGGLTSADVQFSFRDNSLTSGDFSNSGIGTIPAFSFGSTTFGGTSRALQVTLLQPGDYNVALRIYDSAHNYSMMAFHWIVLP